MPDLPEVGRLSPLKRALRRAVLDESSPQFHRLQGFITFCIFVSVLAIVLESVPSIGIHHMAFELVEEAVVAVFTVEYLVNIWVAPDKRAYLLGPWGLIDLLAILPSFLLLLNLPSVKVMRMLRVMRVVRILRVLKLARVASARFRERGTRGAFRMDLQIYFIALFCAVTIWSTLVYYAEHQEPNTLFTSIPQAMWWGIATLTTTGYGDIAPVTFWGRLMAAGTMITGLALFGLLMNVVGEALHVSLFGARQGSAREDGTSAGEADGLPAPGAYAVCGCGQALHALWRLCPICGTPVAAPVRLGGPGLVAPGPASSRG